jgi:hypothetical protein
MGQHPHHPHFETRMPVSNGYEMDARQAILITWSQRDDFEMRDPVHAGASARATSGPIF